MRIELLLSRQPVDVSLRFLEALAELGFGRQILSVFVPHTSSGS
jgi:hypothetical protein